jgi:hypothetical protein
MKIHRKERIPYPPKGFLGMIHQIGALSKKPMAAQ